MFVVAETLPADGRGIEKVEAHFIHGPVSKENCPVRAWVFVGAGRQELVTRVEGDGHLVEELGFE